MLPSLPAGKTSHPAPGTGRAAARRPVPRNVSVVAGVVGALGVPIDHVTSNIEVRIAPDTLFYRGTAAQAPG